jgi:hypothetical protein
MDEGFELLLLNGADGHKVLADPTALGSLVIESLGQIGLCYLDPQ